MHKLLAAAFIITVFASCNSSKLLNPTPANSGKGDTTINNTTPINGDNGNTTVPSSPYTVKLDIANQVVNTAVSNDTLYLVYTEKADIIINKAEYENLSAVHFKEDFSKSALNGFHFSMKNEEGESVYDSVDDNLNNVPLKTASTVVINGTEMVKLNLERVFVFFKAYKQPALAVEAQTNFTNTTKDVITFSSYIYDKKNYDTTTLTVGLAYKKAD
jgi:hypothetical protein